MKKPNSEMEIRAGTGDEMFYLGLCLLKIQSPANKPFVEDTRLMPQLENNGDVSLPVAT